MERHVDEGARIEARQQRATMPNQEANLTESRDARRGEALSGSHACEKKRRTDKRVRNAEGPIDGNRADQHSARIGQRMNFANRPFSALSCSWWHAVNGRTDCAERNALP